MIVGREYILQSLRNNKAFRPASNSLSAVLEAYTRPVTGIENYLFKLESSGSEFLFRHSATGYYLTADGNAPGANIILSALVGSGNTFQRWQIQGNDNSTRLSPVSSSGDKQMTLVGDDEGADVTTQPEGYSTEHTVSFNEYNAAPSGLIAPTLSRFFKNYQFMVVSGVSENATVKIYINDVESGTSTNVTGGIAYMQTGTLQVGQKITAEQILNTTVSPRSIPEYVQENGKVWKTGYVGSLNYQAFKTVVTGIMDANNVETITGQKGEPLGPVRTSSDQALLDLQLAGFTETQFNSTTVTPPITTVDSITSSQKSALDSWMNNNRGSYSGNVQNVLWRNGEIYRYTAGSKALTDTVGVASLSKWFLGALATKAVQDGEITWSTTLGSLVPIFDTYSKGSMTFKQLMTHTGGWPETSAEWASNNPFENQTGLSLTQCADLIAANVPLQNTPGAQFIYSGVGMQMAGRMLEVAYGLPIHSIIQATLWTPLGMTQTSYKQYSFFGDTENPQLAAGLFTTIDDFGKFMQGLLKRTILTEASTNFMEQDQTGLGAGYGIGVYTNGLGGTFYHQGASGCTAWIDRTKGVTGLIFTYDSSPSAANNKSPEFIQLVRNTL
jgi:CubicO group peptidase (beta-lactamase class C family)